MSVTAPLGFTAAGLTAGLKPSGTKDLSLVINSGPSDRRRRRLYVQPVQGQPGPVVPEGLGQRSGQRRRPQLRGSELLHRRIRL